MTEIAKRSGNPIWIGILVLVISIVVIVASSTVLYRRTVTLLTENLREKILTISITAAANIDAKDLEQLQVESDWTKPEWSRVVNKLHQVKYSNKDIVFMYIFRYKKDAPEEMEFVVDADSIDPYANTSNDPSRYVDVNRDGVVEPDGPDKLQWPGQPYPEAADIPETALAYEAPLTSADLYTDDYGTVLTGYAPIRDENGNAVAVLATDIKADDFFTITRQTLQPFLIFIVLLALMISILIVIIIYSWKRYAESLQELNRRIEAANEGQANLLHIINHQIKGYMTKARLVFDDLLNDESYGLSDKTRPMIQAGFDSVTEGVRFVQDFLNASNIDRGTYAYNMMPMEFDEIVRAEVEEQKTIAEKKGLTFEAEIAGGDYRMNGDKAQLIQAVKNLIDNSIKYTPKGSVKVSLNRDMKGINFIIKDTGVGLSDEVKPKLFTKGGRDKDSQKININSTGFGLAFVKGVVEAHKGKVWAESDGPGKGSSFYVVLPVT